MSARRRPATDTFPVASRADCLGAGAVARSLAQRAGWGALDAGELAILVLELTTNAVRHGGPGTCRVTVEDERASVVVEDSGAGFPRSVLAGEPGELAALGIRRVPGGLGEGLACARRLADELSLENRPEGGARARAWRAPRRHTRRTP